MAGTRVVERSISVDVKLIGVTTADGVRLDGALRTPLGSTPSTTGLDIVICHHGVGGNFYAPAFFDQLGDELLAAGCAVMRVNSRGHDQVFSTPRGRLG